MSKIRLAIATTTLLTLVLGASAWDRINAQSKGAKQGAALALELVGEIHPLNLPKTNLSSAKRKVLPALPQFPNQVKPKTLTAASRSVPLVNTVDSASSSIEQPQVAASIVKKFDSIRASNTEPPDPHLAVGPTDLIASTNASFQIYQKNGSKVGGLLDPNAFFGVPSSFDISSDPKFLYDAPSNRFFGVFIGFDSTNKKGAFFIAVSKTNSASGGWRLYRLQTPGLLPDYPGLGVCSNKLVLTANNFTPSGSSFVFDGAQAVVINKSQLVANATSILLNQFSNIKVSGGQQAFTVQPAQSLSDTKTCHMVTLKGRNNAQLYKITGLPTSSSNALLKFGAAVPITAVSLPPAAIQKGTNKTVDTGDTRLLGATYRDVNGGSLWTSSTTGCSISGKQLACAHVLELKGVNASASKRQQIFIGAANLFYYYPALQTDKNNNMTVVFTRSGSSEFPGLRYTSHLNSKALNTIEPSLSVVTGKTFYTGCCGGRWGDYFGAALDPSNTTSIWIFGEYKPSGSSAQWGTFIAQTKIP